jgi:hypothetical protein
VHERTETVARAGTEDRIKRVHVKSSNIASIGYSPTRYVLEVEFQDGSVYQYAQVSGHVYQGLMDAESKGSYFLRFLRDRYPTTKISDGNR